MQELEYGLQHLKIRALGFGDPEAPVILALHGWLDNAASFIPVSQYLEDYYLIALDLPGHGLSDHRCPGAHYHLLDFVQDLHELITSNGWSDIVILGHSMGGILGALYAATFPEKVSKLICIESLAPYTKDAQNSTTQLRQSIESRLNLVVTEARQPTTRQAATTARAIAGNMGKACAGLLVERNLKDDPQGQLQWRTDRRLRTQSSLRLTEPQAQAFLQQLQCPLLLIKGSWGYAAVAKAIAIRQGCLKTLKVIEVEGGHHVHMECPIDVGKAVNKFIRE